MRILKLIAIYSLEKILSNMREIFEYTIAVLLCAKIIFEIDFKKLDFR